MSNLLLKEKIALVTGGAGHIGRETVIALASQGANVIIMDKNTEEAERLAHQIQKDHNICVEVFADDLLHKETFSLVYNKINQQFSRLDFLVNAAAFYDDMQGWGCDFSEEGYEAWQNVLKVNLMAPFFLAQSLAPLMRKSDCGSIVNVSSIYGIVGPDHSLYEDTNMTNPCSYSVSKAGLNQLTRWLSMVLAPDIRVNTVSPGGIEREQPEIFLEKYYKRTPLKRMCTNREVASAIMYLLSPESSYITAHNLVVDGGWTSW